MEPALATTLTETDTGEDRAADLRGKIHALLAGGDCSQAQIARVSGLSAAALSSWLKGAYKGDNSAVEEKLLKWLGARDRNARTSAAMPAAPAWVDTPTGRRIHAVLMFAQAAGDLGCIYGGAGLGKTKALQSYAAASPNVWVSTMSPAHGGVSSALEEIAEAIGLRGIPGRAARLQRELVNRLNNTGGLLIVDEAQHLNMRSLEAIRAIHDATGVGLVLCGNEAVFARLTGGSREATFAQLFSRLGKRLRLTKAAPGDVDAMADAFGVMGSAERRFLAGIASKPGALRGVVKTLRLASVFAAGKGESLTVDHLNAAWHDLAGEG